MARTFFLALFLLLVSNANAADPTFTVGVIAPLSGPLAEYGNAAKNGIELARSSNPALLGNVRFRYEDSQWDAKQAVSAFNKLRQDCNLIFNWGNPTSEAVAPIAEKLGTPLLAMTLDPASARERKFVVRTTNPADDFSRKLADYLKQQNYRKLGVVIAQNTYVQGLYDGLKKHLGPDQSLEVIDSYPISDTDFRASITRLGNAKYDAVGVFLISGQVSTFYRQLQQQGRRVATFGTDFFESSNEIRLADGGMNGAVYPHLAVSPEFAERYRAAHGNDYQLAYAGNAHDMGLLIGTLFGTVGSATDGDSVMAKLAGAPPMTGVSGSFQYRRTKDGDSYFTFPVYLKTIDGDRFVNMKGK